MIVRDPTTPTCYVLAKDRSGKSKSITLYGITPEQLVQKLRDMAVTMTEAGARQAQPKRKQPASPAAA